MSKTSFTNNRILTLDVCRGFMLFAMTFNHLMAIPFVSATTLYQWTMNAAYGKFGFLSNSEGFFFIAGATAGIVYGRLYLQGRNQEIWPRIWKRIKHMYAIYVILLLTVAFILAFNQKYYENWKKLHTIITIWIDQPGIHYFLDHPLSGLAMGLFFLYQLPFFDLFITYFFLFALIPVSLKQIMKGNTPYLLIASITCYIASQYDPGILEQNLQAYLPVPVKLSWFHLGAVQVVFITGFILGVFYVKERLPNIHKVFLGVIALLGGIALFLSMTGLDIQKSSNLGLLRLGLFSMKAYIIFLVRRWMIFSPLAIVGKHSLSVFSYHLALVFLLVFFLSEITALPLFLKYLVLTLSIASIAFPAYFQERRKTIAMLKRFQKERI